MRESIFVIAPIQIGKTKAPVEVIGLNFVRRSLEVQRKLVELNSVRINIVRGRIVAARAGETGTGACWRSAFADSELTVRGTGVGAGIQPAKHLNSAVLHPLAP